MEKILDDLENEFPENTSEIGESGNELFFRLPQNIWVYIQIKTWTSWYLKIERIGQFQDEDQVLYSTFISGNVKLIRKIIERVTK